MADVKHAILLEMPFLPPSAVVNELMSSVIPGHARLNKAGIC